MTIKPIYLSFLLFISMVSITLGQGKKEEEKKEEKPFKCPCTCSCIELASDGIKPTGALNSLPFDEPFILFWKKGSEEVLNGSFSLKSKIGKLIETGKISTNGDYLVAKVSRFLQPNRDFNLEFEIGVGPAVEVKDLIKGRIIQFFLNLSAATDVNQVALDKFRAEIVSKLPIPALRFIKPGEILDISTSYSPRPNDGALFQPLKTMNDILNHPTLNSFNPNLIANIKTTSSSTFRNQTNLEKIAVLYEKTILENIKHLNSDAGFATKIFSGQVNILTGSELESLSKIEKIDKELLKKYMENMDFLISKATDWTTEISLPLQVLNDLKSIKANYKSISDKIDGIRNLLDGRVIGSLENLILESFELKVDSDIIDLETSARAYVGADVGALMANLNNKPDSYRILPYLGLNLYISPVNKRAPINRLFHEYGAKALLRMLSIHTGVTIPTMSSGDYQGIFNVENPKAFIIGIGLRPYRAIKFSYGYLLQNRANGNALNNSFHIASRPYFSVSFDWEVRNIIPDITNLFKK